MKRPTQKTPRGIRIRSPRKRKNGDEPNKRKSRKRRSKSPPKRHKSPPKRRKSSPKRRKSISKRKSILTSRGGKEVIIPTLKTKFSPKKSKNKLEIYIPEDIEFELALNQNLVDIAVTSHPMSSLQEAGNFLDTLKTQKDPITKDQALEFAEKFNKVDSVRSADLISEIDNVYNTSQKTKYTQNFGDFFRRDQTPFSNPVPSGPVNLSADANPPAPAGVPLEPLEPSAPPAPKMDLRQSVAAASSGDFSMGDNTRRRRASEPPNKVIKKQPQDNRRMSMKDGGSGGENIVSKPVMSMKVKPPPPPTPPKGGTPTPTPTPPPVPPPSVPPGAQPPPKALQPPRSVGAPQPPDQAAVEAPVTDAEAVSSPLPPTVAEPNVANMGSQVAQGEGGGNKSTKLSPTSPTKLKLARPPPKGPSGEENVLAAQPEPVPPLKVGDLVKIKLDSLNNDLQQTKIPTLLLNNRETNDVYGIVTDTKPADPQSVQVELEYCNSFPRSGDPTKCQLNIEKSALERRDLKQLQSEEDFFVNIKKQKQGERQAWNSYKMTFKKGEPNFTVVSLSSSSKAQAKVPREYNIRPNTSVVARDNGDQLCILNAVRANPVQEDQEEFIHTNEDKNKGKIIMHPTNPNKSENGRAKYIEKIRMYIASSRPEYK